MLYLVIRESKRTKGIANHLGLSSHLRRKICSLQHPVILRRLGHGLLPRHSFPLGSNITQLPLNSVCSYLWEFCSSLFNFSNNLSMSISLP
jgi:hypothetical protein